MSSAREIGHHPGALEKDDLPILFFRTSCELGFAVQMHVSALAKAKRSRESMKDFLLARSRDWIDSEIRRFRDQNYEGHLAIVRENIFSKQKGLNTDLLNVYRGIAEALQLSTPVELTERLQFMCSQVHASVTEAIYRYGANRAKTRWRNCSPASLLFTSPGSGRGTWCSFIRGPADKIAVHIGNHLKSDSDLQKGALRTFFNLHFFFFHEYLSHAFALWQNYEFVEGYLVWAARVLHYELTRDLTRRMILDETFAARDWDNAQDAENVASWFQVTSSGKFLTFLLEWAAQGEPREEADLYAMFQISQRLTGPDADVALVARAFEHDDLALTLGDLRLLARDQGGLPPGYTPSL